MNWWNANIIALLKHNEICLAKWNGNQMIDRWEEGGKRDALKAQIQLKLLIKWTYIQTECIKQS